MNQKDCFVKLQNSKDLIPPDFSIGFPLSITELSSLVGTSIVAVVFGGTMTCSVI
jgi:hypothetical protein